MLKVSTKVFLSSLLISLLLIGCKPLKDVPSEKTKVVTNDLIGEITKIDLEFGEHSSWFNKEIGSYVVDTETLSDFENNPKRLDSISIKIFMGTWCSDSRREVPRFLNILSFLNVSNYTIIGLDTEKKSPQSFEKEMDIEYVPTFIIYQNGKELNRIIETPIESLEKDLVSIIQAKNYTPNYR